MTPSNLIPPLDPFGIPAPAWVFIFLMNLTLVLHFIALGYVITTALLGIFWSAAPQGSPAHWMLRRTERLLPVALSFAVTLGVAPLLFVQVLYHSFFYPANILIGHQWFGIIPVAITVFYLIYILQGGKVLGRAIPRVLEIAGRAVIFLGLFYILVTHTTNALLLLHPDRWPAARAAGSTLGLTGLPVFWPRLAHNVLALLVVGGVWLVNMGTLRAARLGEGSEAAAASQLTKLGGLLAMGALLFELVAGMWLFVAESQAGAAIQTVLFGARPAALLWMLALLMAMLLLAMMGMAFAGALPRWALHSAGTVLILTLGGMFAGREAVRQLWLAPYFKMSDWPMRFNAQAASSLVLFLVAFVAALVLVGLMLTWLYQANVGVKGPAGKAALAEADPSRSV